MKTAKNKKTTRYIIDNREEKRKIEKVTVDKNSERDIGVHLSNELKTTQKYVSEMQNVYVNSSIEDNCVYCLKPHNGKKCDKQLCRWCNDIGHSSSKCTRLSDPDRITLCRCFRNTFHSVNECPIIWRKYKLKNPIDLKNMFELFFRQTFCQ